ncbi:hypothetical protein RhiirC2_785225 [Rhizophagus irregularis]|uniref:Uncharacterized protein n=1 Tax=Rhizophagus irregularis TaxID=588596 RepID=A0A2N1MWX3_9GLOM|nr:hypothetical protein RhiirC2_785225 [Rhizophagus irregularis]
MANEAEVEERIKICKDKEMIMVKQKLERGRKEGNEKKIHGFCSGTREMFLYDIPARYLKTEVVSAIRQLGILSKVSLKNKEKIQINLTNELEEMFRSRKRILNNFVNGKPELENEQEP